MLIVQFLSFARVVGPYLLCRREEKCAANAKAKAEEEAQEAKMKLAKVVGEMEELRKTFNMETNRRIWLEGEVEEMRVQIRTLQGRTRPMARASVRPW